MKNIIEKLLTHIPLKKIESKELMLQMIEGKCNDAQITSLLTIFRMRKISLNEYLGFLDALMEKAKILKINADIYTDIVGTGGDNKNTFNISTLTCFVVAGAGYNVVKHGNYASSSISGSSNVLEYLGYTFSDDEEKINKEIAKTNLTFLHAPLFHPSLKNVASVRKQLGIRTFFNLLGPLANPSMPTHSLIGVVDLATFRLYKNSIETQKKHYAIIHSIDGYDEISLTSDFLVYCNKKEKNFSPNDCGFEKITPQLLYGGNSVQSAAKIFMQVLTLDIAKEIQDVVILNAAFAIFNLENESMNIQDCIAKARESLESKKALHNFTQLMEMNKK